MLRGLKIIVLKEVKELLRDPKILIGIVLVPIILFPVMGSVMQISMKSAEETVRKAPIAVLDLDRGEISRNFINFMKSASNLTVIEVGEADVESTLKTLQNSKVSVLVAIPTGFTENIVNGFRGRLEIYSLIRGVSIAEATSTSHVENLIKVFEEMLAANIISTHTHIDPMVALHPLSLSYKSVFKGKIVDIKANLLANVVMSQSIAPLMIILIVVVTMQIAASSIAVEKEAKTLETLLTLPVGRLSILTGKLIGSIMVGLLGAISYLVGFSYYFQSMFSLGNIPQADVEMLSQLGLTLKPESYLLLGLSIFIAIVSALALALTIAVFAEDVRSAQALVGYIMFIVFIPAMILMYTDISTLPTAIQYILYVIPFTYPVLITKAVFTGSYHVVFFGLGYMVAFTLIVLYVAAKMFTTEKILTARISFRRRKKFT